MDLLVDRNLLENSKLQQSEINFIPFTEFKNQSVESHKTTVIYMINLISMILMTILVLGILIIYLLTVIKGS